jgi:hypothetical protein
LLGGVAMIRWVTKPTQDAPVKPARGPKQGREASFALRVARLLIGIFVRS